GLRHIERAVVRAVEQVEHLETAREVRFPVQRNALQQPHLDTVKRRSDERLARDDRASRADRIAGAAQAGDARDRESARVATADRLRAQTGSVEVDAAHLETMSHVVDAVDDGAITLIGFRKRPLVADVDRHRTGVLVEAGERWWVTVVEPAERV